MKIAKNTSAFDTRFLRSLFCKVHRVQSKHEGRCRRWARLEVTVRSKYPRYETSAYSGRAVVNGRWMFLSVGRGMSTRSLAALFWHEMMHIYGYKSHRGGRCDAHPDYLDQICEGLPERPPLKQPKQTKKVDIVAKRYSAILAREKNWQQKFDRAQKALKKARADRRIYEKRHNGRLAA